MSGRAISRHWASFAPIPISRASTSATVNSLPALHAAEQEGRLPQLTVVTTDLFPELVERIRAGAIAATVYSCTSFSGRGSGLPNASTWCRTW